MATLATQRSDGAHMKKLREALGKALSKVEENSRLYDFVIFKFISSTSSLAKLRSDMISEATKAVLQAPYESVLKGIVQNIQVH
jgi:hypothetical protein